MNDINYIFVLAGGLSDLNNVNDFVLKRLELAVELYKQNERCKIICLGGGTYHKKTPINENGYIVYESNICAKYLLQNDVKEDDIFCEISSYDTIGNAFFSHINFIIPLNIKRYEVITSSFHIKRVEQLFMYFDKLFNLNNNINFKETVNFKMNDEILLVRQNRESKTVQYYKNTFIKCINTVDKFINWFYTEHDCYRVNIKYPKNEKKKLNESY
jgi:hypothetical protein